MRMVRVLLVLAMLVFCSSINDEGRALLRFRERVELDPYGALLDWDRGARDPCLWFGVECFNGRVISLNLEDLCLKGALAPEVGKLLHMKSIILRNNSFSGSIPREIGELHMLKLLDLRHNNFSGPLPSGLFNILSLKIRGNRFIDNIPPELSDLYVLSELQAHEYLLHLKKGRVTMFDGSRTKRRLLQVGGEDRVWHHKKKGEKSLPAAVSPSLSLFHPPAVSPSLSPFHSPAASPFLSPLPSIMVSTPVPSPSPAIESPSPPLIAEPKSHNEPPLIHMLSPASNRAPQLVENQEKNIKPWKIYVPIAVGVSFLVALSALYLFFCRANRVVTVRPWATGLSGQLQKAFVTGVPALKRSELEAACEDFSNIIGSLSDCKLYKGTLSSGVEIAVVSTLSTSAKDWSKQSESQFRKKISVLSKVNHKNFMNLLGYCAEQEPFTRMMVFEYAPNGTLFEHLHVREAEDLDWAARLRIAMGIAYCLDHMHQLNPPALLPKLNSSAIYLTDDYASKVGDVKFWDEAEETDVQSLPNKASIVYDFGMLMLEILSGRLPFSKEDGVPEPWLSCYLNGSVSIKDLIDPALGSFCDEDIGALFEVIRACLNPDPDRRPMMAQVAIELKEITSMSPDKATPKVSPLWWAEIEILSSEAN